MRDQLPPRCVLDGEIFVAVGDRLEFETLQERIHPAESRIDMLAEKTPAGFVAFDLLALGDDVAASTSRSASGAPRSRRPSPGSAGPMLPHPHDDRPPPRPRTGSTSSRVPGSTAWSPSRWARRTPQNARTMLKIKHERTADVVVAGYRLHKTSHPGAAAARRRCCSGSTPTGKLQHIGVVRVVHRGAAGRADRGAAAARRADIEEHPWGEWAEWADRQPRPGPGHAEPVEPGQGPVLHAAAARAVLEVGYDHMEGRRFRHTAQFKRLAHRPRPRVVRLRPARGAGLLRPHRGPGRLRA